MKKRWRNFWIVCGVTAGIGVACCVVALAMGVSAASLRYRFPNGIGIWNDDGHGIRLFQDDWLDDLDEIGDGDDEDHHWQGGRDVLAADGEEIYEGVQELEIDIYGAEVHIQPSKENHVSVETHDVPQELGLFCSREGSELMISSQKKSAKLKNLGHLGEITFYVPYDRLLNEISVSIGVGALYIEDIHSNSLSVDIGAGEADVNGFEVNEVEMDCGTGTLAASGTARQEVSLSCGTGEINYTASDQKESYDYEIECGAGTVLLGEEHYSGVGLEQEILNHTGREFGIECGMGTVTVQFEAQE